MPLTHLLQTGGALTADALRLFMRTAALASQAKARWRKSILALALLAFLTGLAWSAAHLGLRWSDVHVLPLLFIALALVPLSIAYSAVNMMLMGHAAGLRIDFRTGLRVSVYAQVAELLPIPGGAIVRTAALIKAGGTTLQSTGLVLAFALLWIACAAFGAGIALIAIGWPAYVVAGSGFITAVAIYLWINKSFGQRIAISAVLLRIGGLILIGFRLIVAFAAIGVGISWSSSWGFSLATILGSAASLIPGGLGIGEALSALIAIPVGIQPAAAFIAVALNRLIGYTIHLIAWTSIVFVNNNPPLTYEEKPDATT